MMTFVEFKKIIDEVRKSVDTLLLWNYGEPFLNPEILKMIGYAVNARLFVKTSTNGHFFESKDFCTRLVKSGLNHLIVSLDGADRETLRKYKKKADFNAVIKGIGNIVEARKICGSKTPVLEIQFIIMKHNEHQLQAMRNLTIELGADIYSEKTVSLHMHPDNPRFQQVARKYLPSDPSNSRYYLTPGGGFSLAGEIKNGCSMLYKSTVINSDGSVIPCCSDWYSDYVMGNVFREKL
jgi:MoaA/NifB/PqqE/SkfB family radical SAM enzyme